MVKMHTTYKALSRNVTQNKRSTKRTKEAGAQNRMILALMLQDSLTAEDFNYTEGLPGNKNNYTLTYRSADLH